MSQGERLPYVATGIDSTQTFETRRINFFWRFGTICDTVISLLTWLPFCIKRMKHEMKKKVVQKWICRLCDICLCLCRSQRDRLKENENEWNVNDVWWNNPDACLMKMSIFRAGHDDVTRSNAAFRARFSVRPPRGEALLINERQVRRQQNFGLNFPGGSCVKPQPKNSIIVYSVTMLDW